MAISRAITMDTSPSLNAFHKVSDRIAAACRGAARDVSSVTLVAVSKTYDAPAITPILDAGHRIFGENRVQEAKSKWPQLRQGYDGIELHLIGPLQSNKVSEAVFLFDVIQSVDRPKIAEMLAREMEQQKKKLRLFLQINTGDESQKSGVPLADADRFIEYCMGMLPVEGLMCIPPVTDSAPKHFAILARLAHDHRLTSLSMGMSSDFESAIACGATHVRVGSAIFGAR